jgi:hypothetical protein
MCISDFLKWKTIVNLRLRRVCVGEAVVYGYRRQLFLGSDDAYQFRKRAYSTLELDVHPIEQKEPVSYPLRTVVLNRSNRGFASPSMEEIRQILESGSCIRKCDENFLSHI